MDLAHGTTLPVHLTLWERLQMLGERGGVCVPKSHLRYNISDISQTKQSRAKITYSDYRNSCRVYGLLIGNKSRNLAFILAYFSGEQHFSTTDISHTFCRSAMKCGNIGGLANRY